MINSCEYLRFERFPFDTNAPIGYTIAIVIEYVFLYSALMTIECIAIIASATLPILFSLLSDLNGELKTITVFCSEVKMKRRQKLEKFDEKLSQFVKFHSDVIQ